MGDRGTDIRATQNRVIMALWTLNEQQAIKPISANNTGKFTLLAEETQIKDLKPLIGYDFYQDLIQNPESTGNAALLEGGEYTYNGVTYTFRGLKYTLAYFLFANYVMSSWFSDTFTGFVTKTHEDAQPVSSGEKKNLRDINVEIAMQDWHDCLHYIAANSQLFPYYLKTTNRKMMTL